MDDHTQFCGDTNQGVTICSKCKKEINKVIKEINEKHEADCKSLLDKIDELLSKYNYEKQCTTHLRKKNDQNLFMLNQLQVQAAIMRKFIEEFKKTDDGTDYREILLNGGKVDFHLTTQFLDYVESVTSHEAGLNLLNRLKYLEAENEQYRKLLKDLNISYTKTYPSN